MIRLLRASLVSVMAFTFVACPGEADGPDPTPTPTPDDGAAAVCLEGEAFVDDGTFPLDTAAAGDAHEVAGLRWEPHEGCERFVIDLATDDGQPATAAGEVEADVLRELGVVRVTMRDVELVAEDATDAAFDGPLASAAYAVWADEGRWVYVDLHLAGEAEVSVQTLEDPARVVVDLRPGGGPVPEAAATSDRVVVLAPRAGQATYPLTVTGYARTFEANVVVRVEQDGQTVEESFTTATAWVDAWGHYSLTVESGPSGAVELHVGEYSARDGAWEGASVELTMS